MNVNNSATSSLQLKSPTESRAALLAIDRYECEASLINFLELGWSVLEPEQEFSPNWHLEALCEHLEAVTYGWVNRLLINVPPGTSKSLTSSVFWPAWEWGPKKMTSKRYLATSFNDGPVKRDTRKMRTLITSDWYQLCFPHVKLVRAAETSYENSKTGSREGVPFGSLTSQRGDRVIIDDPHSTKTAESEAERTNTTRQFREGAINRLNDQEKSAIIVIMQRLHGNDVSGEILANEMGYTHLLLPMEYSPKPFFLSSGVLFDPKKPNDIGFVDPRKEEGELLDRGRFPRPVVEQLKKDMGPYGWAGQYQQQPVPREGGMFKREWFDGKIVRVAPEGTVWVRHWDLAATRGDGSAWTAGVKMGRAPDGRFVVGHVIRVREEGDEVRKLIRTTAASDNAIARTIISLPKDPGQAGKVQSRDMVSMLAGNVVYAERESGDKALRAEPFSVQCEAGNVILVEGPWIEAYLDEICLFPGSKYKDQADASSGAFGRLIMMPSTAVFGSYGS